LVAVIVDENIDLSVTEVFVLVIIKRPLIEACRFLSQPVHVTSRQKANRMNCIRPITLHWKVIRAADACVLGISWLIVLVSTVSPRSSSHMKPYNAISASVAVVWSLKQSHSDYAQRPLCQVLGAFDNF